MHQTTATNLRSAERYLIDPPLTAVFGDSQVAVSDISTKGARVLHDRKVATGSKALLTIPLASGSPAQLEALVVWTQQENDGARFVSGLRTYGPPETIDTLMRLLAASRRTHRIEELRSTDRYTLTPPLGALVDEQQVLIENLSTRGVRIESPVEAQTGQRVTLRLDAADLPVRVSVSARVAWSAMKSVSANDDRTWRAGLSIEEKPEMIRLVIGHLCATSRAALDTRSLGLKLKIMRARARQHASTFGPVANAGIPAEQYLLVQGVREELRLNPEEAIHWYRRARLAINDPDSRVAAAAIADHPDALAVWEYLERSVDASIVGRAFHLELR